jgi:hypothetical protein
MSATDDWPDSKPPKFEVLPGLPGTGPLPEQFTATGRGTHSEGFVIRFYPDTSDSWVGNFQSGDCGCNRVFAHPDDRTVVVIAGGQAYQVDPATRTCLKNFGGTIVEILESSSRGVVVIASLTNLWLLDANGERWVSGRISVDGIRQLRIEGESVAGEAYDPTFDRWYPFVVSLETGRPRSLLKRLLGW